MHQGDMQLCVNVAKMLAKRSRAMRAQVGCVIWHTEKRTIISLGYNGTPAGEDNTMELNNKTLDTVIHAEINAIKKLSWWTRRKHLVLFVTHSPCVNCANAIVTAGIRKVYYLDNYGTPAGLNLLRDKGVEVKRLFTL
jgi:dCMP deaminase